jgi:hypothetical protein
LFLQKGERGREQVSGQSSFRWKKLADRKKSQKLTVDDLLRGLVHLGRLDRCSDVGDRGSDIGGRGLAGGTMALAGGDVLFLVVEVWEVVVRKRRGKEREPSGFSKLKKKASRKREREGQGDQESRRGQILESRCSRNLPADAR